MKYYRMTATDGAVSYIVVHKGEPTISAFYDADECRHEVYRIEECDQAELEAAWVEIDNRIETHQAVVGKGKR